MVLHFKCDSEQNKNISRAVYATLHWNKLTPIDLFQLCEKKKQQLFSVALSHCQTYVNGMVIMTICTSGDDHVYVCNFDGYACSHNE